MANKEGESYQLKSGICQKKGWIHIYSPMKGGRQPTEMLPGSNRYGKDSKD